MKTKVIASALVAVLTLSLGSCGTSSPVASTAPRSTSPFDQTYQAPGAEIDTDEYFAGFGVASGSQHQMGEVHLAAVKNAQDIVRMKLKHCYKGMLTDYSNQIGNNNGTDIQTKLERAGEQIIDAIVNDTRESTKPEYSGVDDKGYVKCFVNIRIYKDEFADKMTEKIADAVSDDEELSIRFKEAEFNKKMKESFKQYKEENK